MPVASVLAGIAQQLRTGALRASAAAAAPVAALNQSTCSPSTDAYSDVIVSFGTSRVVMTTAWLPPFSICWRSALCVNLQSVCESPCRSYWTCVIDSSSFGRKAARALTSGTACQQMLYVENLLRERTEGCWRNSESSTDMTYVAARRTPVSTLRESGAHRQFNDVFYIYRPDLLTDE